MWRRRRLRLFRRLKTFPARKGLSSAQLRVSMSKAPTSSLSQQQLAVAEKTMVIAAGQRLRPTVLAYHELTATAVDYSYALTCRNFEEHLQLATELIAKPEDGKLPLVFSFDDGHISNYTSALPLLQKYSCKAIFFVICSRVGEHKDYMTWENLRELAALGHRVEAHGWSHTFLTRCSDSELHNELERSREVLQERTGAPVTAL